VFAAHHRSLAGRHVSTAKSAVKLAASRRHWQQVNHAPTTNQLTLHRMHTTVNVGAEQSKQKNYLDAINHRPILRKLFRGPLYR